MTHSAPLSIDDPDLIATWPTEDAAAVMLGVTGSVLAGRDDLERELVDSTSRHYRPTAVLCAGADYKRRSLNALAAKLIAYAREHGDEQHAERVRAEIDDFFASRPTVPVDKGRILKQARRALPRQLYVGVQRAFDQGVLEEAELRGADVDFAHSVEIR